MVRPEAAMHAQTKLSPLGHQKLEVLAESGRQTPSFIKVHKYISRYLGYLSKDFFQEACLVPTHAACVSDFLQGKPDMPTFHQFRHEMWATGELWEINGTPHGSSQSFAQRTKVFADLWRHSRSCNVLCNCSVVFVLLAYFSNANVDQILRTVKTTNNGHQLNYSSSYTHKNSVNLWVVKFLSHQHF